MCEPEALFGFTLKYYNNPQEGGFAGFILEYTYVLEVYLIAGKIL